GDHLGHKGIDTNEALAWVKSTLVRALHPERGVAVLNAADPLVAGMAAVGPGRVSYFAADGSHPLLVECPAQGGRVAFVGDGPIMPAHGENEASLMPLADVPITHGGAVAFQVENVLAAALACAEVPVDLDRVRKGLGSFTGDPDQAPGRFNVLRAGD